VLIVLFHLPDVVKEFLRAELAASGADYFVGQFAYGDLVK
jgi:hypothetical protein